MTNNEVLLKYFNHTSFRDIQEDVINNLLAGHNSLCLMPTGAGKSIIYQVAGIQTGKVTIVISPLLALMKQQNKRLTEQGVEVLSYNSSIGDLKAQFVKLRKAFKSPTLPQFIFVSPEKILSDGYLEFLLTKYRSRIGLVVVDEAHCISQWGHTFRPAYKVIPYFLNSVFGQTNWPPVLCLTATLNPKDKYEICKDLKIHSDNIFRSANLLRSNLYLTILDQAQSNSEKSDQLKQILDRHKDEKIIVYTHIKAREYGTREMSETFKGMGYNCHYFDADMQDEEKLSVLEQFESGSVKIVFATSAFGMGIDIPDIRVVVHYLVPESIEQYYQEVGRAGRDRNDAYGYMLHSDVNFRIRRDLIKKSILKPLRVKEIIDDVIMPSTRNNPSIKRKITRANEDTSEKIFTLGRMDVREDNSEMRVFLYLLQNHLITLRGKGIQFSDCFEGNGSSKFEQIKAAASNGMITRVAKKLNRSIEEINFNLFEMFNQEEIKLTRVPTNVLNYTVPTLLSDEVINEIHETSKERGEDRLFNFEKLISLIESGADISSVIREHLGIEEP